MLIAQEERIPREDPYAELFVSISLYSNVWIQASIRFNDSMRIPQSLVQPLIPPVTVTGGTGII
jgi:hypothetical protein